ncbi:M20/M25/M40 family metallo-hydrolase [Brevundimonas sp.]|uniref:M20/M25/M40 family metallo-hydrolase n=1 Tax=Brevundimonas sp. TaxID=1871086 RepID=UPI00289F41F1|nr:M20/M25/M40 family metallo-hydrolase [Brevundimonas sp.]
MRLFLLLASLAAAFALAVVTTQTPPPVSADAAATAFSAQRAMIDVRRLARAPHPVGSAEHEVVQAYLFQRMAALGLRPERQTGVLSPAAVRRIEARGDSAEGLSVVNLVGVSPGRRPDLPAVLLMAHYDSVPGSPGAADDAAGVAGVLEAVRAIQARGPADRDLVVLLTDGEELNLDGARAFFSEHRLRSRIGAVVNLEARGGGGRAMMFETGPGNAQTIDLFARATGSVTGGATGNALAVFVYRLMPNGTDFTVAADRGLAGVNLAFLGRPDQYHSPRSTPEALDQGSVQHIGSQALEAADGFLRAPTLPRATANAVHADVFGLIFLRHSLGFGWVLLATAAALTAFAAWGARHATGLGWREVGRGVASGLWLVASALVVAQAVRVLAGPVGRRIDTPDAYYTLLRRLPWMEAGVGLAVLAAAFALLAGRARVGRRTLAAILIGATVTASALGGLNAILIGATAVAVLLTFWPGGQDEPTWGGWLGLIVLVLIIGAVAQAVAPEAAFVFIWSGLAAALAAATAALIGARLQRRRALIPAVVATIVAGGWMLGLGHFVFLGVGMDLPGALGVIALLIVVQARPLGPVGGRACRVLAVVGAACMVLACGVSLAARWAEPAPPLGVEGPG